MTGCYVLLHKILIGGPTIFALRDGGWSGLVGRGNFSLHSDMKSCSPLTRLQRNTNTLKHTCSKSLWNKSTALSSAVRMRDYFPSVPSTYYSRLRVAWQQYKGILSQLFKNNIELITRVELFVQGTVRSLIIYYRRRQGHCVTWQQRYAEVQSS